MTLEVQIQTELIRLLNKWSEGYETNLLEEFVDWTNKNLISPYEIVEIAENYAIRDMWVMRIRK